MIGNDVRRGGWLEFYGIYIMISTWVCILGGVLGCFDVGISGKRKAVFVYLLS